MELPQEILSEFKIQNSDDSSQQSEISSQPIAKPKLPKLRVMTEKRRGKFVTIIWSDQGLTDEQAEELAHRLKQRLAVGGSCRDGEILLQGNLLDKVMRELEVGS